ncbi:hypothetical protein [Ancylobacter sp. FA202]|uniref:hypothetical protein n=1 Tax=Ancylobacter sp. FA202 TaxID=1111106 RepID=UPI001FD92428|nr:hypothetical protein [Ancylobacter sp. FA202]
MDTRLVRILIAMVALVAACGSARAQSELLYKCGGDLGFVVETNPESSSGNFHGAFSAPLVPDGNGAWVNPGRELQFWPEGEGPKLFIGSEQFSCEPVADEPGMNAGGEPADSAAQNTADLEMLPYGSTRGWEVVSLRAGSDFVGCAGSINLPAGFLILQKKTHGWELRVPADQTEGFEGGVITLDGRRVDAQFGFTPEGAGEAGLDDAFVAALRNGKLLTTKINGSRPVKWPLSGSAAVVTKIEECFSRQGRVR